MRIRHKTPSIFNLSMVDVLCCALGCVLLLWLWNLRKAQDYQNRNLHQDQQTAELLVELGANRAGASLLLLEMQGLQERTEQDRNALNRELTSQRARVLTLETQLNAAANRQALTTKNLEGLRAILDSEKKLAQELNREKATLEERLKALQILVDRLPTLEKELASARQKEKEATLLARGREADLLAIRDKEKQSGELLRTRDADLAELARRVQALTTDKAALDKAVAALATEKTILATEKTALEKTAVTSATDLRATQTNLNTSQTRVRDLEKELATTIRTLLNLQDEKKALEAKAAQAKAASDARFAGIELSGRRVVFLVDTSTSMIETSDGRPFPEKWAGVVNTVVKVMESLPEMESYQLVLFSRESAYPLGQSGEWLRFDRNASTDLVRRTLMDPRNKPDGGTNMFAGLENAFKMRANHMDTVYLFSDGLPSRGVGVEPNVAKLLTDTELARRLGDHVRKTLTNDWNRPLPNLPKVRIHSIGFFYDSPDVGAFLWALSRENNGSFVGMSRP